VRWGLWGSGKRLYLSFFTKLKEKPQFWFADKDERKFGQKSRKFLFKEKLFQSNNVFLAVLCKWSDNSKLLYHFNASMLRIKSDI
jgi:hypothetical protein